MKQSAKRKKRGLKQNDRLKKKEKKRKPKKLPQRATRRKKTHKSKYGFSKKYGVILNSIEIRKHYLCIIYPLQIQ